MKALPQVLFWLGIVSVPLAWLMWFLGSEIEVVRSVLGQIDDPALGSRPIKGISKAGLA